MEILRAGLEIEVDLANKGLRLLAISIKGIRGRDLSGPALFSLRILASTFTPSHIGPHRLVGGRLGCTLAMWYSLGRGSNAVAEPSSHHRSFSVPRRSRSKEDLARHYKGPRLVAGSSELALRISPLV